MRQYYPSVVEVFEESIKKPPKEKKRTLKKKDDTVPDKPKRKYTKKVKKLVDVEMANLSGNLNKINLSSKGDMNSCKANVSVSVNKLKRKLKTKEKQKTIDSFIANKKRKSGKKRLQSLSYSFKNLSLKCSTNDDPYEIMINSKTDDKENKAENKHLLSTLNVSDSDFPENDLSDIIDKIVNRAPVTKTAKVENNILKLVFDKYSTPKKCRGKKSVLKEIRNNCSTPNDSPIRRSSFRFANMSNNSLKSTVNTSYFFEKWTDDRDAFELSMDLKHNSLDCDVTVDYSLPDVRL